MKQTNGRIGRIFYGLRNWFACNMGIMRSAWSLYRSVAGRAAVFAGVFLVAPYALLTFLTMQAVSFDVGKGLQMFTGVGYVGDWAGAIIGRLRALSSLSSLISYAVDLFLLPCACAAFAFIFSMRWRGMALPLKATWQRIRPLIGRIMIAGIAVMLAGNFVQMAVSLISGLLSMVAGLLGFIPLIGPLVYGGVFILLMLLTIGMLLITITVLMFTMLTMTGERGGRGQLMMGTMQILWGGRRDVMPSVLWLLAMSAALLAVGAGLYGILFAATGAVVALVTILIVLALIACAAIPLMCAFLTVVYMHEYERQGGRTYIYTQHD